MKLTKDKIKIIITDCANVGYNIKVRDISYVILCEYYDDINIAYMSIYGDISDESEVLEYDKNKNISFLKKYMAANVIPKLNKGRKKADNGDGLSYKSISLEENRDEMLKLLDEIDTALTDGKIEYKDAIKMKTDIRTKLNDKFGGNEKEVADQKIIVNSKYSKICPHCGHEV